MTNREKINPFDAMLMNYAVKISIIEAVDLACVTAHAFKEQGATPRAMRMVIAEIDNYALRHFNTDQRREWLEAKAHAAEGKRKQNRKEAAK